MTISFPCGKVSNIRAARTSRLHHVFIGSVATVVALRHGHGKL